MSLGPAQKRYVGSGGAAPAGRVPRGDREAAALASPRRDDRPARRARPGPGSVDRAGRVNEQARVVVLARVADAASKEARRARGAAIPQVRSVGLAPAATLATA